MDISKSAVLSTLDRVGFSKRYARLGPETRDEIAALCQGGMRQIEIAGKLGLHEGHVWHVLEQAGLVAPTLGSGFLEIVLVHQGASMLIGLALFLPGDLQ